MISFLIRTALILIEIVGACVMLHYMTKGWPTAILYSMWVFTDGLFVFIIVIIIIFSYHPSVFSWVRGCYTWWGCFCFSVWRMMKSAGLIAINRWPQFQYWSDAFVWVYVIGFPSISDLIWVFFPRGGEIVYWDKWFVFYLSSLWWLVCVVSDASNRFFFFF